MAENLCQLKKKVGGNGINLKGFSFEIELYTVNTGNNRTYALLPIDNIKSFKVTSSTGSASYKRFGWYGNGSESTDIVVNTVYTKPSDATALSFFIQGSANSSNPAKITIEIVD